MKKVYFLSKNGTQTGPFEYDRVIQLVSNGNISWADYVFDESKRDWVLLLIHADFAHYFLPDCPPKSNETAISFNDKAWYILRDGNNYGPFSQLDIIQMLQNKSLYEFDFVWKPGNNSWSQISTTEEFSTENIRDLHNRKDLDISEIFFRRRHLRAKFGSSLVVHNSKSVFKGISLEISSGGAGIVLESSNIQPGQSLFLHFKPGEGVPPFNAICQVVSKQTLRSPQTSESSRFKYGVRFTNISTQVRDAIETFIKLKPKVS